MTPKEHIQRGREAAAQLTERQVFDYLAGALDYYFEWNGSDTLDGWSRNIANCGGTFGSHWGRYDTNAASTPHVDVCLRDGRQYRISKSDLFTRHKAGAQMELAI